MKLSTSNKGTYVSALFDDFTLDNIQQLQKNLQLLNPTPRDKLHTTIVYSRVHIPYIINTDFVENISTSNKLEVWDTKSGKTLVLMMDSEHLNERHFYSEILGGTYDFDEYKPHITLSYDIGPQFVDLNQKIDFPINISSESIEDLDLNWSDGE